MVIQNNFAVCWKYEDSGVAGLWQFINQLGNEEEGISHRISQKNTEKNRDGSQSE